MSVGKVANRNASRRNQEWEKAARQIEQACEWMRKGRLPHSTATGGWLWLVDGVFRNCGHSIIILFLVLIIMIKTDYGSHLECYGLVWIDSSPSMHLFFLLCKWQPNSNLIFGWLSLSTYMLISLCTFIVLDIANSYKYWKRNNSQSLYFLLVVCIISCHLSLRFLFLSLCNWVQMQNISIII